MNNPSLLSKYLAGNASDEEVLQCEKMLQDSNSVEDLISDLDAAHAGDSLVETLRNLGNSTTRHNPADSDSASLVEQSQSLVARPPIGQEEFDRILSPAESSDEIGRIAHYRVIEFIAGGGMGLVFKAEDSKLNRLVCIKVLNPNLATNGESVARFAREAKAAAKLRNTRITTVLEFGEHRELPYLVMELLEGQSLRDKINVAGKLDVSIARKLTIQIAEGLRYAHQRGYLHRDIKPENIWVTPEGDAKLLDFGLARAFEETTNLTHSGTILGTPTYMSPEQVRGKELDARSDLFSVGTVLFEMLTGESPFGKSNLFSTMMSVANDTLAFPETTAPNAIPDDMKPVINSLLQKSPENRMESADQLIVALKGDGVPRLKTEATKSGKDRLWVGLLGGVAGACCLALAFLLFQYNDKGTLVVEADPSINVSIADEEVSIEDPQTGKKFKVTIGDHPLPSGVYQLQMIDESGQYMLSSEVIAIRRGEKQIVRLELKPEPASMKPGEIAIKEPVAAKAKSTLSLATLPTLDAAQLKRKLNVQPGDALFKNAIVTEPENRPGVTSWSVEPTFNSMASTRINSDGSRIAILSRHERNKVAIWSRDGQLTQIVPAQDEVREVKWSPDPNIIAVIENGNRRKQVSVWKLFDGYMEAIDVIPGKAEHVAWSTDGLLLAVQNGQDISFIDLSKGSVFAHPNFGVQGKMSVRPWSRDGRYFATTVEDEGVKIWDLEERKLLHVFSGKRDGQFLPAVNQIAINEADKWEVWDLDSFVRTRTIELDSDWKTMWPNPQFQKLAIVTDDCEFILKDLQTGAIEPCTLKLDSFFPSDKKKLVSYLRSMKLDWALNGNDFVSVVGGFQTFLSNADRVEKGKLAALANLDFMEMSSRKYVHIGSGHRARAFSVSSDSQNLLFRNSDWSKPGPISSFNLTDLTETPPTEVLVYEEGLKYLASHDGKTVAIVGSDIPTENGVVPEKWLADLSKVHLCSLETGKLLKTLDTGHIQDMLWSPDSKSLIVSVAKSTKPTRDSLFKKYIPTADAIIDRNDANSDGKLDKTETKNMRRFLGFDLDKDGFITRDEFAQSIAAADGPRRGDGSIFELETRIINVQSGQEILLQANSESGETKEEGVLCFQRLSSRQLASPVLCDGQIVLPLFDVSTFIGNRRTVGRRRRRMGHKDKLGFFDLKTGQLTKLIELNSEFSGDRFAVNEHLVSIGISSRENNSLIDSFMVFDRLGENRAYVPTNTMSYGPGFPAEELVERAQQSGALTKGVPYLSPSHPYVAVAAKNRIEIWNLNSQNSTFRNIKTIHFPYTPGGSKLNPSWHPSEPTFAWIAGFEARCYRVEVDQMGSCDAVSLARGISPISDGWLVAGSSKMVLLGRDFKPRKTWLPTERLTSLEDCGTYDQCVLASGETTNAKSDSNMRVVQLRDNRIETRPMSSLKETDN